LEAEVKGDKGNIEEDKGEIKDVCLVASYTAIVLYLSWL